MLGLFFMLFMQLNVVQAQMTNVTDKGIFKLKFVERVSGGYVLPDSIDTYDLYANLFGKDHLIQSGVFGAENANNIMEGAYAYPKEDNQMADIPVKVSSLYTFIKILENVVDKIHIFCFGEQCPRMLIQKVNEDTYNIYEIIVNFDETGPVWMINLTKTIKKGE